MLVPPLGKTLNIAHRGARSLAPENTLAAARKALALGADMWELDVCSSSDGQLYVVHDDTLERTSNVRDVFAGRSPFRVGDFTLAEVTQLDFGAWFVTMDPFKQIAAGKVTGAELAAYRGEHAPTLRDALVFTRDNKWRVNVEIKDMTGRIGDADGVEKVVALIAELGMGERVIISSFNHRYLERARKADATIALGALVEKADPDPAALLRRLSAQAYHPRLGQISPNQVAALRAAGFGVNIWTVNEPSDMEALMKAGASGLFTDFPQTFAELQQR
jgi:glycerophosphoryl diester phosphodiesterase